jgi:CheY-like chemotaxis protein
MPRSVLLVDDNLAVQKLVELSLRKEGFEISSVDNALSAIDLALKQTPDLILADYNLEGMNIFTFIQKVRQKERLAEIPIVLLINSTESYDPAQLQSAGIQAFLKKPIDAKELTAEAKKQTGTSETVMIDLNALSKKAETSLSEHFSDPGADAVKIEELLGWSSPGSITPEFTSQMKTGEAALSSMSDPQPEPLPVSVEPEEEILEKTQFFQTSPLHQNGAEKGVEANFSSLNQGTNSSEEEKAEAEMIEPPRPSMPFYPEEASLEVAGPGPVPLSSAAPVRAEIEEAIKNHVREAIERVAWEILPGLIESALSKEAVKAIIEEVVWEVVPPLAEIEIVKEIKRLQPEEI